MALPKNVTGYRFLDKDPSIDLFRYAMEKAGLTFAEIAEASGVSEGTLRNWDLGNTRKPQHLTMRFAMAACGYEEIFVDEDGKPLRAHYGRERRGSNVVHLRKAV